MDSPLINKSPEFATMVVLFYEDYSKSKRDTTIAKQLLRSATSVGANTNEAIYGSSRADFIAKLHISLKEVSESIYWLTLLKNTKIFDYDYDVIITLGEEIKRMLISSINTAKTNLGKKRHPHGCLFCHKYSLISTASFSSRFIRRLAISSDTSSAPLY